MLCEPFIKNMHSIYDNVLKGERSMPEPIFEIYKGTAGKFRFRLKAPNGEIIATGEAYESKDGCKKGIASVKENAPKAKIKDLAV